MIATVLGYMILISIDFYDFKFRLRRCIKHSRQCLTTFPTILKFVKNTLLHVVFSTLFLVFGNVVKHSLLCLIYYFKICFRHLVLLEMIVFRRYLKQSHRILQYDVHNLCTKFLSTCYSNFWWISS